MKGGPPEPGAPATLSVVIVSWNTRDLLRRCLLSLREHPPGRPMEIRVVDNASTDGSPGMVRDEFPGVELLEMERNLGFSAANNAALRRTEAEWVLLLNPDTEVLPGALDRVLDTGEEEGTVVAARLLNPDGSLQPSTFRFPGLLRDLGQALWVPRLLPPETRGRIFLGGYWNHEESREVDWALGAFLMVPAKAREAAGPLPEDYPLFGEDMEWCRRLRDAGYPVRYEPRARVLHHGNQAAGQRIPAWRIRRTHAATYHYLRRRRGAAVAVLHRAVLLLNYLLRAGVFSLLGLFSRRRRRQGEEYRLILGALLSGTRGDP